MLATPQLLHMLRHLNEFAIRSQRFQMLLESVDLDLDLVHIDVIVRMKDTTEEWWWLRFQQLSESSCQFLLDF